MFQSYLLNCYPTSLYQPVGNFESTPIAPSTGHYRMGKRKPLLGFENISPIVKNQTNFSTELQKLNIFSTTSQLQDFSSSTKSASEGETMQDFGDTYTVTESQSSSIFSEDHNKENEINNSSALVTSSDLFSCLQNSNVESQESIRDLCGNLDDILDKLQKLTSSPPNEGIISSSNF